LEKKKAELEAKELAQWEAQADPNPENRMPQNIFKMLNEKLLKEKEEVHQALCKAYESMPEPVNYEEKIALFKDALAALKDPNVDVMKKNELLKACIDKITYKREKSQRYNQTPIELDVKLRL
jgi:hypothetical protein